jgi:hypothetical protein
MGIGGWWEGDCRYRRRSLRIDVLVGPVLEEGIEVGV